MAMYLSLFVAIAIYASLSQAQSVSSATSTSTSGPLLTGYCSVSFKTSIVTTSSYSFSYASSVTSGNRVYATELPASSPDVLTYVYRTLGCLSNQTACCPFSVAAPSVNSANPTSTPLPSLSPNPTLSSCPPDYSTTHYTPTTTSAQAQALCCPTGWGVYDDFLPDHAGDTNPCFSSVPKSSETDGQPSWIIVGIDENGTYKHFSAVFTRSYLVQAATNNGSGNGGTKRVVEIVVPVVVVVLILCLGIGFWWWKKKSPKKKVESQPGATELGEGLRHELEGRSFGMTMPKEADITTSELESKTPLQESKNKNGGVELDSIALREMGANVPAAYKVEAKDENLTNMTSGRAELI